TAAAADRIRRDPESVHGLFGAYFDIRLDGARMYVAIGWDRIGQAAIRAPVVHTETVNGQLVLRVGPVQGAWYDWGNLAAGAGRADPPALRAYFQARGQLEVVDQLTP